MLSVFNKQSILINTFTIIYFSSIIIAYIIICFTYYHQDNHKYEKQYSFFQYFYLVFIITFIGLRPIGDNGFTDSPMYIQWIENARDGNFQEKDLGFNLLIYISSFFNYQFIFLLCSFLTFFLLYLISKKINEKHWFIFFVSTIASLFFWNYIAFSIYALFNKTTFKYLLFLVSISIHKSYLLPSLAYIFAILYKSNVNRLIALWVGAIITAFFYSDTIVYLVGKIFTFIDSRSEYFLNINKSSEIYLKLGFRYDMIIYSLIIIIVGIYHMYKKNVDFFYTKIFITFIISNISVILLMNVNQIYRFMYLSWFLSPIILYYPLIKNNKKIDIKFLYTFTFFLILVISYYSTKIIYEET